MDVTSRWWISVIKETQSNDRTLISVSFSTQNQILKLTAKRLELVSSQKGKEGKLKSKRLST